MPITAKTLTRTVISFFLTAVFLYLAFRNANFDELWTSLKSANVAWIIALVPINVFSHWIRALRWRYMLTPIKRDTSLRNLFSAVMIGYLVNNVLPRAGEFVRPYVAGKLEHISRSSALGTVVLERILDTVTFLFTLCIILFLYPNALAPFVGEVEGVRVYFLLGSLMLLFVATVAYFKSGFLFRFVKVAKPLVPKKYAEKLDEIIEKFLSGINVSGAREHLSMIAFLSLVLYAVYGLALLVAFYTIEPIAAQGFDFGTAMVLLTVATVAYVLPAPGGMGTYHSFLTFTLVSLYSVDQVSALSFSIITHEISYLTITVTGIVYFLKDHLRVSEITAQTDAV
ncbi:MAG: flippase-like domain-containing protein [Ignavibacteriae bacterium]|nr:flippase-like domain-containing protein [Ignavibacteriota bacterium]